MSSLASALKKHPGLLKMKPALFLQFTNEILYSSDCLSCLPLSFSFLLYYFWGSLKMPLEHFTQEYVNIELEKRLKGREKNLNSIYHS